MLLLGETFDARTALRIGLVDAVVSAADLDAAVEARLEVLLAAGVEAFGAAFESDEPAVAMAAWRVGRRARRGPQPG